MGFLFVFICRDLKKLLQKTSCVLRSSEHCAELLTAGGSRYCPTPLLSPGTSSLFSQAAASSLLDDGTEHRLLAFHTGGEDMALLLGKWFTRIPWFPVFPFLRYLQAVQMGMFADIQGRACIYIYHPRVPPAVKISSLWVLLFPSRGRARFN